MLFITKFVAGVKKGYSEGVNSVNRLERKVADKCTNSVLKDVHGAAYTAGGALTGAVAVKATDVAAGVLIGAAATIHPVAAGAAIMVGVHAVGEVAHRMTKLSGSRKLTTASKYTKYATTTLTVLTMGTAVLGAPVVASYMLVGVAAGIIGNQIMASVGTSMAGHKRSERLTLNVANEALASA